MTYSHIQNYILIHKTNIFYFEHIQSTELSTQLWMKNELQFNWLSNTDKYLCFIFMDWYTVYTILEWVYIPKHIYNKHYNTLSNGRVYKFIATTTTTKNLFIIEWLLRKLIFNIFDFLYNLRCAFISLFSCELLSFTFTLC